MINTRRFSFEPHCLGRLAVLTAALLLSACAATSVSPNSSPIIAAPITGPTVSSKPSVSAAKLTAAELSVPREFRAAWVATVANIDWPSQKGLSAQAQLAEIEAIVAKAKQIGLNALIVQVRPSADAIYPSGIEPWTEYLSGRQGQAPAWIDAPADKPVFDPLQSWIRIAHESGIALHAWFNPYRASHPAASTVFADNHISRTNPSIVKSYDKYLWLDPSEPQAAQRTLDVIMDVVNRYDIDGVHIDDYFYPYPVAGIDFPDSAAWEAFRAKNPSALIADWRRQHVNQLVERIHLSVHQKKPWLQFGISPFGIGKPSLRPASIKGFSQYDSLYADVELWLSKGWLDYLAPQLYWPIDQAPQAFSTLLDYWASQNTAKRFIWPGLFTSKIDPSPASWTTKEIIDQVQLTRSKQKQNALVNGHMHFSMAALMQNRRGIADQLQITYAQPAVSPVTNAREANGAGAINEITPNVTLISRSQFSVDIPFAAAATQAVDQTIRLIVIWKKTTTGWQHSVHSHRDCPCTFNMDADTQAVAAATINRFNVQSVPVQIVIDKK